MTLLTYDFYTIKYILKEKNIRKKKYYIIVVTLLLFSCQYAPDIPGEISGPSEASVKEMVVFSVSTVDPQEDNISYQFDWGNENKSTWTEFMDSDVPVIKEYVYYESGTYEIRVRAMDDNGYKSKFSKPHRIIIK